VSDEKVYEHLTEWLKQTWWGLPDADELMPLIKATYNPEEAALLTGIPFSSKRLEELAQMKQMEPVQLEEKLDELARKGLIFRTVIDDIVRYRPNDSFFTFLRSAFWAGGTDKRTRAMAPLVNQYYYHGFF
jgi:hypothetical protein